MQCAFCDSAISGGATTTLRSCDAGHSFHVACLSTVDKYLACPACAKSCVICHMSVSALDRVGLCGLPHAYHGACLTTRHMGSTSACIACEKDARDALLAPTCPACGDRIVGMAWTGECDREHGYHAECLAEWDAGRLVGCIVCKTLAVVCPICDKKIDPGHSHRGVRCKTCKSALLEDIAPDHSCTDSDLFGGKLCFWCGKGLDGHAEAMCDARMTGRAIVRGGKVAIACPICAQMRPDMAAHIAIEHAPMRCRECRAAVDTCACSYHASKCDPHVVCPADGCKEIIKKRAHDDGLIDPGELWRDHACVGLFDCPNCEAAFFDADAMSAHARECDPDDRVRKRPRRRRAFEKSDAIVRACADISEEE